MQLDKQIGRIEDSDPIILKKVVKGIILLKNNSINKSR